MSRLPNDAVEIPTLGLRNKVPDNRHPLGALSVGDNVDIMPHAPMAEGENARGYEIREGSTLSRSFTSASAAFSTKDGERAFVIDDGSLKQINRDLTTTVMATGFGTGDYHFDEIGEQVLVLGSKSVLIDKNLVYEFRIPTPGTPTVEVLAGDLPAGQYQVVCAFVDDLGREGPASPNAVIELDQPGALTIDLNQSAGFDVAVYVTSTNGSVLYRLGVFSDENAWCGYIDQLVTPISDEQIGASALPAGVGDFAYHDARVFAIQYIPKSDTSVIWMSKPYWPHLFRLKSDFYLIPGKVISIDSLETGLVIGTNKQILTYAEGQLVVLAEYGVVEGNPTCLDKDGNLYIWSELGLCEALPFRNLTDDKVSLPPGSNVSVGVVYQKGVKRVMVLTDTEGESFNQY